MNKHPSSLTILVPILAITFLMETAAHGQTLTRTGQQFFALVAPSVDSTSQWYERVFAMRLIKEIKIKERNVHVRIIENEDLKVEILGSHGVKPDQYADGFMKVGFYVKDIDAAEKYFQARNVKFRHKPFDDAETKTKSFILEDNNGNLIQVIQQF